MAKIDYTDSSDLYLKNIGHVLAFRPKIDKDNYVTKYIRSHLAVADIIPVDYNLSLATAAETNGLAISYDFNNAITNYRNICDNYKLDNKYGGLRLWLTDETQSSEEISHSFEQNLIEAGLNKISGFGNTIRQYAKSAGNVNTNPFVSDVQNSASQVINKIGDGLGGWVEGLATDSSSKVNEYVSNLTKTAGNTALQMVLHGKQLSLPKIWRGCAYSPSLTLSVKLVAPYGHPECIKRFIIEPLIYILLLSSPRSNDGLTYGLFQPIRLKAYGISNINLGAIESVSIRRGGRETSYNFWKQPLIIDVILSIKPLTEGFAAMEPGSPDVASFDDSGIPFRENSTYSPAITTIGNIIQSLRPAPNDVTKQNMSSSFFSGFTETQMDEYIKTGEANKKNNEYSEKVKDEWKKLTSSSPEPPTTNNTTTVKGL